MAISEKWVIRHSDAGIFYYLHLSRNSPESKEENKHGYSQSDNGFFSELFCNEPGKDHQ